MRNAGKIMEDNLRVIAKCLDSHPMCKHGATLLFERESEQKTQQFYACSAYRDQSACPIHISVDQYIGPQKADQSQINIERSSKRAIEQSALLKRILKLKPAERSYCHTCNVFILNTLLHNNDHEIQSILTDDQIKRPTTFLKSMSNDKREAQYFFSESSLKCFANIFGKIRFNKVICIGAPRLHEYLKFHYASLGIESILLDLDERFYAFFNQGDAMDYFHYNMFNNYFFAGSSVQRAFGEFLKKTDNNDRYCIFTDPPFGCRTEPLVYTLKTLNQQYRDINKSHDIFSIFWIFPYFMEMYIKTLMPEMTMLDYKVDYTNHETYHSGKNGRKQGSPVRLFTNVPEQAIELPSSEGYRFCKKCKRWVSHENQHCNRCKNCPSKNGSTYKHCNLCAICVKPSYIHCNSCWRCTQAENHDCVEYQLKLKCPICFVKGHNELNCHRWFSLCGKNYKNIAKLKLKSIKTGRRICFICFKERHNEQSCSERQNLLKETIFSGKYYNLLSSELMEQEQII